jgi:hypothetical protein
MYKSFAQAPKCCSAATHNPRHDLTQRCSAPPHRHHRLRLRRLEAARALRGAAVDVTLVDKTNHHLFQPLLYQVATAGLSAPAIAAPIRTCSASSPM